MTGLPLVSVIVPVYNEARTVDALLRRVCVGPYPYPEKEIVIVDDGSSDATPEVLRRWRCEPGLSVLRHSRNFGKGAAIRTGLEHARGHFTIIQDADLEYDPEDYTRLIEPLKRGDAQVVYGSRYLHGGPAGRGHWNTFRLGVSALNLWVRVLYGIRLTDEATCYKAFPTSVLRAMELECTGFEFCPEVTAKACRLGLAIREVSVRYAPRALRDGKKIRWRDGLIAFAVLWKWRKWRAHSAHNGVPAVLLSGERGFGRTVRSTAGESRNLS